MFTPPGVANIAEAAEDPVVPLTTSPGSLRPQTSVPASERTNDSGGGTASALPRAVVVSGLEHTTAPSQRALMRVLTERRVVFDAFDNGESDLSGPELEVDDGTWNLPYGFVMIYVCKGDPHERPAILRGLVNMLVFVLSQEVACSRVPRHRHIHRLTGFL